MLRRGLLARKAKALFYHKFNDVDIYVEDTGLGAKKLHEIVFGRVFEGRYRVAEIFPLGGRQAVVDKCREDSRDGGRPRVYVIDGDLELMVGVKVQKHRRLVVLSRYCIENYLVDELAALSILDEEDLEERGETLRSRLDFKRWVRANERALFDLFVVYAVARRVIPEERSVSAGINRLMSAKDGVVDRDKVEARRHEFIQKMETKVTDREVERRIREVEAHCLRDRKDLLAYVSGKDFVLPLLLRRMRMVTKMRADNTVIRQRLARRCDVSELRYVLRAVEIG